VDAAAAGPSGAGAQRNGHPPVETRALAGTKKHAQRRGQTIVFVDESGLSERPHRVRTWTPRGQTPVLQFHFHWKTLSVMAGITWWNFYFNLFCCFVPERGSEFSYSKLYPAKWRFPEPTEF
jgi:hypothetical protein